MTAIVIENLLKEFEQDSSVGVAYFYFSFRQQERQKIDDLLLSIAKQLLRKSPQLPKEISFNLFWKFFLVIDALDECSFPVRPELLSEVSKIQFEKDLRVLATSRPIGDIIAGLNHDNTLTIHATDEDVEMTRSEPALHIMLVEYKFLLAQLYLEFLRYKTTERDIMNSLNQFPERGQGTNEQDKRAILSQAYEQAEFQTVEDLLKEDVDTTHVNSLLGTALHVAAGRNQLKIAQLLLNHKVDVNCLGGVGGTALEVASFSGIFEMVKLLLANKANFHIHGGIFDNALQAAAYKWHQDIFQVLLSKGATVNSQQLISTERSWQAASFRGYTETARLLIRKGADKNGRFGMHGSALQAAAYRGRIITAKLLLEENADVNLGGGLYGNTLQAALVWTRDEDEDEDEDDHDGAFYEDVIDEDCPYCDSEDVIDENDAHCDGEDGENGENGEEDKEDDESRYNKGGTNEAEYEEDECDEVVDDEVEDDDNGYDYGEEESEDTNLWRSLFMIAVHADLMTGNFLLLSEPKLYNTAHDNGTLHSIFFSVLQAACQCKTRDITQLLLDRGADIHRSGGVFGTALAVAASLGATQDRRHAMDTMKLLLERGADVNARGGVFDTTLQASSIRRESSGLVELLIRHGADVRLSGGIFGSALHAAAYSGCLETVAILVEKGADVNQLGGV
ncbi:ankyrin repeat domain-containing protein [Aspergillus affinis]|uniref:ankyrin repeat domain-containing protein n=1 Tax=Aspergillus affinis TaxID=1070780 RepID=UPI0022FE1CBF|nr:ankyrin repeat domain containing protein [Aspergillus affinis]KAI9039824.1 ankyrin repeat domain containing protein [Aspergillus affinis]